METVNLFFNKTFVQSQSFKIKFKKLIVFPRSKPAINSKAMRLGGKSKDVDSFVDQLKSEGQHVSVDVSTSNRNVAKTLAPSLPQIKTEKWVFQFSYFFHILEKILTRLVETVGGLKIIIKDWKSLAGIFVIHKHSAELKTHRINLQFR